MKAIPEEMQELMRQTMAAHLAAHWQRTATPEQEEKRKAEGKTFEGAADFLRSVAEKYRKTDSGLSDCVAMPDAVAWWLLGEYMENWKEGDRYRTAEDIEAEEKERERRKAENAEWEKARDAMKKAREEAEAAKQKARAVAEKMKAAQLSLFDFEG